MFVWDAAGRMRWVGGQADVWAPAIFMSDKLNPVLSIWRDPLRNLLSDTHSFWGWQKIRQNICKHLFFPLGPGDSPKHSG
jgi:hypothetical protein